MQCVDLGGRRIIKKNINEEFNEAKIQVKKIGNIRLEKILIKNL